MAAAWSNSRYLLNIAMRSFEALDFNHFRQHEIPKPVNKEPEQTRLFILNLASGVIKDVLLLSVINLNALSQPAGVKSVKCDNRRERPPQRAKIAS